MTTEAEARQIVGQEGATVLDKIIRSAWQDHLDEKRTRSRTTRANIVWDYMTARANKELVNLNGVTRIDRYDRPLYVLRDRIILRFKKHDEQLLSRNVSTKEQRALLRQGQFDGLPYPHLSTGYVLDPSESAVAQTVVVRRIGDSVSWYIDLTDLATGNFEPNVASFDELPENERPPLPGIGGKPRPEAEGEEE